MSLKTLKVHRDIISMEAFHITEAPKLLTNIIPSMAKTFKGLMSKFHANQPALGAKLPSQQKEFLKRIEAFNYLDLTQWDVEVPERFVGNFLDYSQDLRLASASVVPLVSELLNPFSIYLAKLATEPNYKFDTTNYFTQFKSMSEKREQVFNALTAYFGRKEGRHLTYADVVSRNSDWMNILENLKISNDNLNSVNRTELNKKTQEISSYLDIILKKIQNKEYDNVSAETTRNLAEGVYQVANELERLSVIYYQTLAFNTSIETFIKKINTLKV